jgi:signal transduction histidine kinase
VTSRAHEATALRTFLYADLAVVVVALVFVLAIYVAVVRDPWVLAIAALVTASGLVILRAVRDVDDGRLRRALVLYTVSTWLVALSTTAISPWALHVTPLVVLLPVVLAVPCIDRRRFAFVIGATVVIAVALTMLGRLQMGARLEELAPRDLRTVIAIVFVPMLVALVAFQASQNHAGLSEQAERLRASRTRLVTAIDRARRRLERDLHDGAQQRLVAAAVRLRVAQRLIDRQPERATHLVGELIEEIQGAISELRHLAHGIYPPELTQHGLEHALRAAALRSPRPTTVHAHHLTRYPPDIEATVYFCCREALLNAIKYGGEDVTIDIALRGHHDLVFEVTDTGPGFAPGATRGQGLDNITDRLGAHGGTLTITTTPRHGTRLRGTIPLGVHAPVAVDPAPDRSTPDVPVPA